MRGIVVAGLIAQAGWRRFIPPAGSFGIDQVGWPTTPNSIASGGGSWCRRNRRLCHYAKAVLEMVARDHHHVFRFSYNGENKVTASAVLRDVGFSFPFHSISTTLRMPPCCCNRDWQDRRRCLFDPEADAEPEPRNAMRNYRRLYRHWLQISSGGGGTPSPAKQQQDSGAPTLAIVFLNPTMIACRPWRIPPAVTAPALACHHLCQLAARWR